MHFALDQKCVERLLCTNHCRWLCGDVLVVCLRRQVWTSVGPQGTRMGRALDNREMRASLSSAPVARAAGTVPPSRHVTVQGGGEGRGGQGRGVRGVGQGGQVRGGRGGGVMGRAALSLLLTRLTVKKRGIPPSHTDEDPRDRPRQRDRGRQSRPLNTRAVSPGRPP